MGSARVVSTDRLLDRAEVQQTTLVDRYRAGEFGAVWDELVAMGARVREPELMPEVVAVAEETMRRARMNVERLIDLLPRHGLQFQFPVTGPPGESVWAPPSSETPAQLRRGAAPAVKLLETELSRVTDKTSATGLAGEGRIW